MDVQGVYQNQHFRILDFYFTTEESISRRIKKKKLILQNHETALNFSKMKSSKICKHFCSKKKTVLRGPLEVIGRHSPRKYKIKADFQVKLFSKLRKNTTTLRNSVNDLRRPDSGAHDTMDSNFRTKTKSCVKVGKKNL